MTTRAASPSRSRGQAGGAVLALVRWPNVVMTIAGIIAGAWWVSGSLAWSSRLGWTLLAGAGIAGATYGANDAFDASIDTVARPERPVPRGALSRRAAWCIVGCLALVAVFAAMRAGGAIAMLTPFVLAVALSYSPALKPFAGVGNVATAIIASLPFVYGAEAAGNIVAGLPLLGIAVPLHFAREVAKDVPDIAGDSGFRRTIPIVLGLWRTRAIVGSAVALYAVAVTFLFADAGPRLAFLLPSLAVAAAGAWHTRVESARRAPALFKLAMLLAMAALPFIR